MELFVSQNLKKNEISDFSWIFTLATTRNERVKEVFTWLLGSVCHQRVSTYMIRMLLNLLALALEISVYNQRGCEPTLK